MKKLARKYVIGIDEVGRGALAGPVVVAAVCFPAGMRISNRELGALKDSKKLSPRKRELWREYFKTIPEILSRTARVYPRAIEKINISRAANRAAGIASERLIKSFQSSRQHSHILENVRMFRIFLDGGLYLVDKRGFTRTSRGITQKLQRLSASSQRWSARTIVLGDEKITAIKVASIIAKVQRDRYMEKLSKKYPRYGFEIHKGYGTKRHMRAIKKHGPSKAHRLTFLRFS